MIEQSANIYHAPAPRFIVGDVLGDGSTVSAVGWHTIRAAWWVNTRLLDGMPHSGGVEQEFAHLVIVVSAGKRAAK